MFETIHWDFSRDVLPQVDSSTGDGPPVEGRPDSETPLDPEESTPRRPADWAATPPSDEESATVIRFRHSHWQERRRCTFQALRLIDADPRRLERFENCGKDAWVMKATSGPVRYRVACAKCRDRWCEACQGERRLLIRRNLSEQMPPGHYRLLTLTVRSSARPLAEQLDGLYAAFSRFRKRKRIAAALQGGLWFFEVTVSPQTGLWHPHLHVIWRGAFLSKQVASAEWHDVTGDSFIVDVRFIRSLNHAVGYVAKYAAKLVSAAVWRNPEYLAEAMEALDRRKLLGAFGSLAHIAMLRRLPDDVGWECIGSLTSVMRRAKAGDRAAQTILQLLTRPCITTANDHAEGVPGRSPPTFTEKDE
jgi:hypothetical protein